LKQKDLIQEIKDRHRKAEKKRRQDVRKMNDLAQSLNPNKPIPGIEKAVLKMFPENYTEGMFGEAYTFLDQKQKWYDIYNLIEEAITGKGQGKAKFDFEKGILNCEMSVARNNAVKEQNDQKEQQQPMQDTVKFDVELFESRLWKDRYTELDMADEIAEKNKHRIFVVRITRTEGDTLVYNKLKNGFILTYCSSIIKGLPDWARKLEQEEAKDNEKDEDEQKDNELVDDYSKTIGNVFEDENKGGIQVAVKN